MRAKLEKKQKQLRNFNWRTILKINYIKGIRRE